MTGRSALAGLHDEARTLLPGAVELRRRIHASPELGLHLPRTQALIADELRSLGLEPRLGSGLSSVTAVLEGGAPGPTILLRADMDALPLRESTGLPFASQVDGAMHGCGHDLHLAMLLSAARLLVARREQLRGRVLLMFQPGEEGYHGARMMLDEGLLDDLVEPPAAAYAAHVTTRYAAGTIATRAGPMFAASDVFRIVLRGRGGHASAPHETADPIPAAAELTLALRGMVPRRISALDPAVVTVAHVAAGTTHNIIPDQALLEGTVRTFSEAARATVRAQIEVLAGATAAAHGLTAETTVETGYPATINDPAQSERVLDVAAATIGAGRATRMPEPRMAAEDFSYVLQRVPGAIYFVGACPAGATPGEAPDTHSDLVVFEEAAMAAGIAVMAGLVLRPDGAG